MRLVFDSGVFELQTDMASTAPSSAMLDSRKLLVATTDGAGSADVSVMLSEVLLCVIPLSLEVLEVLEADLATSAVSPDDMAIFGLSVNLSVKGNIHVL